MSFSPCEFLLQITILRNNESRIGRRSSLEIIDFHPASESVEFRSENRNRDLEFKIVFPMLDGGSLGYLASNKNRELVRLLEYGIWRCYAINYQTHLQSSCSMNFIARNHQLSIQLRQSFEIDCICNITGFPTDWGGHQS